MSHEEVSHKETSHKHQLHHSVMTKTDGNVKFVLMMAAFLLLAFLQQGTQNRQNNVIDRQAVIVSSLQSATAVNCAARNENTAKFNQLIDELVTSVEQGKTLPENEQKDRVLRYTALKVPLQICTPGK